MKYPNKKDYIDDIEGYLDEVVTACLTNHKEIVNDSLVNITNGKITKEQQSQYFIGKQLFSDEPIYKLLRLISNYRNEIYKDDRENLLFAIMNEVELAKSFVAQASRKDYDKELRTMAQAMFKAGIKPKAIAEELCDTGWYNWDNLDSLERSINRWIEKYNF